MSEIYQLINPIYTEQQLKEYLQIIVGKTARSITDAQIRAVLEEALKEYVKH